MQIIIINAQIQVTDLPNGAKQLNFTEPNGNIFSVPLDQNGARAVVQALTGIAIANGSIVPPNGKPN